MDEHWRNEPVQPVLLNLPVSTSAPKVALWGDIARVCRRVCVLRERGRSDEAETVRGSTLAPLLAALETHGESSAAIAARLEEIFAAETERAANASALAEILLPLLVEQLGAAPPAAKNPRAIFPAETPPSPPPAEPAPRHAPGGIADFIDEMIAQERKPPQRRAS